MNCQQFEAVVHDLKRPEALDEASHTLARFHAQSCVSCAALLARSVSLSNGLRALAASDLEDGAPPRLESVLRSAFLRAQWENSRARAARRWTAVGIAAALLLTAGLASWYLRQAASRLDVARTGRPVVAASTPQSLSPAGPVVSGASNGSSHAAFALNPGSGRNSDDIADDFLPYPPGSSMVPFESGQIVRVAMPGSALVALGFPLDGDRSGDRFTADVLVGDDGLPHAIRLVR